MQAFFGFIQKLCALVMLALLADLLIPSGATRRYVRLACGMLVLHIMVSQVFALLGRGVPDVQAQEWTQLIGEIGALPDSGAEAALSAYRRQAERLILDRARALGMSEPSIAVAWDAAGRPVAVVLRAGQASVQASVQISAASAGTPPARPEADPVRVRAGLAGMLGIPETAIHIQKEGSEAP